MIVGFTGNRGGMTVRQRRELHDLLMLWKTEDVDQFHHGDCIGSDADAHDIAVECGYEIHVHPGMNKWGKAFHAMRAYKSGDVRHRPKPFMERNHDIVDVCEQMIASPDGMERLRSGTWATVRYARKVGRPITILNR